MDGQNTTLLYGVALTAVASFFTLLTVIANAWFAKKSAADQRKWQVDDREFAEAAQKARVDKLHEAISASAQMHQASIDENKQLNQTAIVEAKKAYTEANDVNGKIAMIAARLAAAAGKKG